MTRLKLFFCLSALCAIAVAGEPVPGAAERSCYIGLDYEKANRVPQTVLTTRKSDAVYQALVRYQPIPVPVTDIPGLADVAQAIAQKGAQLPQQVYRIDQETEMLMDSLGENLRSIMIYRAYVNPVDGHVLAYDLAQTAGGQPQRMLGHLTKTGVAIDTFRGTKGVDHNDINFPVRDTFIPVEMEFIHQWYLTHPDALQKAEPVKFSVFIPEVMGFVLLVARPLSDEVIPVGDSNWECARYDVTTVSTQSSEGLMAHQIMWFDKRSKLLMKREDYDPSLQAGEAPVTERAQLGDIEHLRPMRLTSPELQPKAMPFKLDTDYVYNIEAREEPLGRITVRYSAIDNPNEQPGAAFKSVASVTLNGSSSQRRETATTWFDVNWEPLRYDANGNEITDASYNYALSASIGTTTRVALARQRVPRPQAAPVEETKPAANDSSASREWKDPLRRISLDKSETEAEPEELPADNVQHAFSRALSPHTFINDFNRVEHLAVMAARFPLPPLPKDGEKAQTLYQKAGIYSVRQNRAGVLLFEITPEPLPQLTERKKQRLIQNGLLKNRLFLASAGSVFMPCRMLLASDGRLLQLTMKYSTGEVTYTLEDPIMRKRADIQKKQQLQEGPQLLRPPWW